jgi:ubiquinone/menaquinone biosynthesis C-methylase UbiE
MTKKFDPIWDHKYKKGHAEKYPWDSVVSFVFRHRSNKPARETSILEIGCGTGANLWFAAREGFQVSGIDGSKYAIEYAKKRFKAEKLKGEFIVGNFLSLPYNRNSFDLIIDRAALACVGKSDIKKAIDDIHNILKPGGKFFFTPYSNKNASANSGIKKEDDLIVGISDGGLQGVGQLVFFSLNEVKKIFSKKKWEIVSLESVTKQNHISKNKTEEFHVVVMKLFPDSNSSDSRKGIKFE